MKQKGFVSVDARWENVKECIFIGVLDQEKNQEYFEKEQIPHYDWEGLSFFCMLRQEREDRIRLIHVNEFMTKAWGHCFQNVFVQGMNNTEKDSVLIKTEREYIFTNRMRAYGTAGVFFSRALQKLSEKMDVNFFVLPVTADEAVLLPDTGEEDSWLETEENYRIPEKKPLSEHRYYYDRKQKDFIRIK